MPAGWVSPRDLTTVVEQILEVIPEDEEGTRKALRKASLIADLFRSPETMWMAWDEVSSILNDRLGEDIKNWPDWKYKVQAIFGGATTKVVQPSPGRTSWERLDDEPET